MDSFLRKHKLIDTMSFQLNCDKNTFIEKFEENVEPSDLSFQPFEAFSKSSKLYKGTMRISTFTIQKKSQLLNQKKLRPIANGKIKEDIDSLKINLEINGISPFLKFFFFVFLFFELVMIFVIGYFSFSDNFPVLILPVLFIHASVFLVLFYFLTKSSVKYFKQEIEREFHFWLR